MKWKITIIVFIIWTWVINTMLLIIFWSRLDCKRNFIEDQLIFHDICDLIIFITDHSIHKNLTHRILMTTRRENIILLNFLVSNMIRKLTHVM